MKGRDSSSSSKGAPPSTDLLVCFPSRAHLTLLPKPICSPARHRHPHPHNHHKKPGLASPLLWAKSTKHPLGPEPSSEPTSPKVTCAGQIKVRPATPSSCRNWQSVMEEIERIHNHNHDKHRKRPSWGPSLGFKKEVVQFLTCLRSIRFDFRCFGAFPGHVTDDDEDEEDDNEDDGDDGGENQAAEDEDESKTVFSKWFMVLQENQEDGFVKKQSDEVAVVPPANALLLMRCRSAPVQTRLEHEEEQIQKKKKKRDSLEMVMKYDTDFYEDVAEETWVAGGLGDPFSRSRSWKR